VPKADQPPKRSLLSRKRSIAAIAVIVLFIAAATAYYFLFLAKPAAVTPDPNDKFVKQVNSLLKQPAPADPIEKAIFYAQIAQNYDGYGDTHNALQYFLKAQAVIDDNNLSGQIVYYPAIANDYHLLKDKGNERQYTQKYLDHLQQYAKDHPDDEATKKAIDAANKRLSEL